MERIKFPVMHYVLHYLMHYVMQASFTERISFHAGGYDAADSYVALDAALQTFEAGRRSNRLFFLSVPPTIFGSVTERISQHARAATGFTRLMIEKPFGRDSPTFDALNALTSRHFAESQLFRLDHYLGKEVTCHTAHPSPSPRRPNHQPRASFPRPSQP